MKPSEIKNIKTGDDVVVRCIVHEVYPSSDTLHVHIRAYMVGATDTTFLRYDEVVKPKGKEAIDNLQEGDDVYGVFRVTCFPKDTDDDHPIGVTNVWRRGEPIYPRIDMISTHIKKNRTKTSKS